MGTYTTRLGCQLSFSEEKEADIIAVIQKLNATHKTGQFISNLLRIALENPEVLDKGSGSYAPGSLMRAMENCGISYDRQQFFQSISKDVANMKQKIDDIYDLAFKTYTLGLMGKHLQIEEKSNNELMATFILERQLKDIQTKLALNFADSIYASNKALDVQEKAEEVMEYIIESYSGIVNELMSKLEVKQIEVPVAIQATQQVVPVQPTQQVVPVQPVQPQQVTPAIKPQQPVTQPVEDGEDKAIDFGDTNNESPQDFGKDADDLELLKNFFSLD